MADAPGNFDAVDRRNPVDSAIIDEETLDKSMHYRFIQERPTRIARAKLKGYRVVRPSEDGVKTLYDQEDKPAEDMIKHGDRVLMMVPKKRREEHQEIVRRRSAQRLTANEERVRELARERKIKLHERDEED